MVDKADVPDKKNRKFSPLDDIPEALRDTPSTEGGFRLKPIFILGGLAGLGIISLLIAALISLLTPKSPSVSAPPVTVQPTPNPTSTEKPDRFGDLPNHLPYKEADKNQLEVITADGRIKLHKAAAKKYKAMIAAARSQGVIIVPISGFRSVNDQDTIFFGVKAQRNQDVRERAKVSAPPGYSEHHTGYAVDIGDGRSPATDLKQSFENTKAFKWMRQNAARYQFELSFPKNNPQGLSYEPWHWRFVGDIDSLETFYRAKNLK
ncbi:M15 family metallopeptidase [Merismopedia glauca]|uniref:D-alanyl-D-alanine carboxypeptidase n=1 Tax=Merismopedia glauca CCAP 1448/3 TaxID=1296344 RepID=A0A2T1C1X3_9CYAN|nr:M15 family metallopeptidase [Merismopedia glauca]PSB02285.1 D-alanyl-D-alanine carboxypeptidase [Merismopedia glauca CCAP 1448/3]